MQSYICMIKIGIQTDCVLDLKLNEELLQIITIEFTNIKIYAAVHFLELNTSRCNSTDENESWRSGKQERGKDKYERACASF